MVDDTRLDPYSNTLTTLAGNTKKNWFLGGVQAMASWRSPLSKKAVEKSLGIQDQSCPMRRLSHKAMWLHT